jgi:hypothetical protein
MEVLGDDWRRYGSMMNLTFKAGSELRQISQNAFPSCASLASISLTASVTIVHGLKHWSSLSEDDFDPNAQGLSVRAFQDMNDKY